MAGKKYINLELDGSLKEVASSDISSGVLNSGDIVALDPSGRIDKSMMPVGFAADIANIAAFENLNAGDFVNVFDDAGVPKVRKADATIRGKRCDGFVLEAVIAPNTINVYFEGTNTQVTGQTIGANVFLQTVAGAAGSTVPNAAGNIVQRLGRAISATAISFEPAQSIEIA